jgi:site-specific recombinase XerD
MTDANVIFNGTSVSDPEANETPSPIAHTLFRLSKLELPAKEHFESYLRYKARSNHKPKTIESSFTSIMLFLTFYGTLGKTDLKDLHRADLEAFIEHEQDRGMHITTVKTRTACIVAFLHFLIEQELIPGAALKKRIRFKLPDLLPRAMHPDDVKKLLSIIDHTRDRALILLLLRTGIRIGEALSLTINDLDLKGRKVHLYQGEKNDRGRVVYLSNDAVFSLKRWLRWRDPEQFVFARKEEAPLSYSAARSRFKRYLIEAGLEHKGYTVHSLRHTYASELLNAGMRLEVLQQLMGHQDIEMTRRYARLTDRTREEEYFRAMAKIEKGADDGNN